MIEFRQNMLNQNYLDYSHDHYHQRVINLFMQRQISGEADQPIA